MSETASLNKVEKLQTKEMVFYGIGDITANLYLQFIGLFMIIFYTDVLGIPAVIAGFIAMGSRIFDGLNDVLVGYVSDKTGRYKRWILWGSIATAIAFVIMFSKFNITSSNMRIVSALVIFCIWTFAYTCYAIPYNAFAATMTQDTTQRTKLNSIRFAIVAIPSFLMSLAIPFLKSTQEGGGTSYRNIALTFALIATLATIICVRGVKERAKVPKKNEKVSVKEYFKAVMSNRQLLILSIAFFLRQLTHGVYTASMIYYFTYYYGSTVMMSSILFLSAPLSALGALSVPRIVKKIGKKKLIILAGIVFAASNLIRFAMPSNKVVVLATSVICMFAIAINLSPFFTMIADTTDYGMWLSGKNTRAVNYGFYTFCQKIGMAFSASFVGYLLMRFGYVANIEQTPQALNGILIIFCIIPACLSLAMSIILSGWKLNENRMDEIVKELKSRQEQESV